ncbi:hypothetical protein ACFQBS_02205 [Planomonospora parontospora]|nr:hypothetical protein [Planomonospora parontospora]
MAVTEVAALVALGLWAAREGAAVRPGPGSAAQLTPRSPER